MFYKDMNTVDIFRTEDIIMQSKLYLTYSRKCFPPLKTPVTRIMLRIWNRCDMASVSISTQPPITRYLKHMISHKVLQKCHF